MTSDEVIAKQLPRAVFGRKNVCITILPVYYAITYSSMSALNWDIPTDPGKRNLGETMRFLCIYICDIYHDICMSSR